MLFERGFGGEPFSRKSSSPKMFFNFEKSARGAFLQKSTPRINTYSIISYSTVTDLARLRGLSTSQFLAFAI
mgnify:CR=1 FL=1